MHEQRVIAPYKKQRTLKPLPPVIVCQKGPASNFWKQFEGRQEIGSGMYGSVYKARRRADKGFVAIKKCKVQTGDVYTEPGVFADVMREVALLYNLKHKNVIRMEQIWQYPEEVDGPTFSKVFMVMEYCERNLRQMLNEFPRGLAAEIRKNIMHQTLDGIEYCQSHRVIHRDLKPDNILLVYHGDSIQVKIADFGLSRVASFPGKAYSPAQVTAIYRAPEIFYGSTQYAMPVDMWSIGCIFAELVRGRRLFGGMGNSELAVLHDIQRKLGDPKPTDVYDNAIDVPKICPVPEQDLTAFVCREDYLAPLDAHGVDLLSKMLLYNPRTRIRPNKALKHAYFSNPPSGETPTSDLKNAIRDPTPPLRMETYDYTFHETTSSSTFSSVDTKFETSACFTESKLSISAFHTDDDDGGILASAAEFARKHHHDADGGFSSSAATTPSFECTEDPWDSHFIPSDHDYTDQDGGSLASSFNNTPRSIYTPDASVARYNHSPEAANR
ncbi:kinase-like domain-containing protein [Phlyctochytrium arcticum]|nr:kinase-like domain-containing protein [Phlyctochytrium arcticum]